MSQQPGELYIKCTGMITVAPDLALVIAAYRAPAW